MQFKKFAEYLEKIENTASRNEITKIFAELFKELDEKEIKKAIYLLAGRLAPKYVPLEFNFSSKLLLKSFDDEGFSANDLYRDLGDIGLVVEEILKLKGHKTKSLDINSVYQKLDEIARMEGSGSQTAKMVSFQELINNLSPIEGKFIGRMIIGKLRLGVSDKTMLDGLSWFKVGDKSMRNEIERAFGVRSDIGEIAEIVKKYDGDELKSKLENLKIKPGTPVASKLVEREKTIEKVFERLGICFAQPKLDGLRAQIHFDNKLKEVNIFSRNMENMTYMFPDLVEYVQENFKKSFVLDSEAIGFDKETGEYLPFQETIQRKRKHDIGDKAKEIPIKSLAFDLLYFDDKDISHTPVEERIDNLKKILGEGPGKLIELLETIKAEDADELEQYFEDQVAIGLEGIIVKKLGTYYEPGTRNYDWIKMKASLKKDMVDTVDAVVMGYYDGRGVRAKFGLGAILIGIFDEVSGGYKTVAKVGTGITDDLFVQIKKDLDPIKLDKKPDNYEVDRVLKADGYVEPKIVVEVESDEITRSKMHTAAKDKNGKGLSMRFPRLKVWDRKDKDPEGSTTPAELEKMFGLNTK